MRVNPLRRLGLLAALLSVLVVAGWSGSAGPASAATPYDRQGMWIWYISSSENGSLDAIIRRARRADVGTLYIKSGDGTNVWSQFTRSMVRRFQRAGLKVCGWQYVYGREPAREAAVSAVAKKRGADCFVIDAEAEYEGRYSQADRYIRQLRRRVGPKFKLALSTFPYNNYHQGFPYSVFLGPGAATANLPQVYWKAIGDSVREAVGIAWRENSIYERQIYPVGQTWMDPSAKALKNFRRYAKSYGVAPSWWSWQETSRSAWRTLGRPVRAFPHFTPSRERPVIRSGSSGDTVVWMQQYLVGAGYNLEINGIFGKRTKRAVRRFQRRRGLGDDGVVGPATWRKLLRVNPVRVRWSAARSSSVGARVSGGTGSAPSRPLSADIPMVRNEIAGAKRP
ncbi:MAG: peptidoglycan-binding protein [Solirubrobacterales bacterium]|nr:peptidoglycan-binding protein [Solirubrobacterales bacterium]